MISTTKNVDLETLASLFNDLENEYKIEIYKNKKSDDKIEISPSMTGDITDLINLKNIKSEKLGKSQKIINYPENESYTITIAGALLCNMIEIPQSVHDPIQKVLERYIK